MMDAHWVVVAFVALGYLVCAILMTWHAWRALNDHLKDERRMLHALLAIMFAVIMK